MDQHWTLYKSVLGSYPPTQGIPTLHSDTTSHTQPLAWPVMMGHVEHFISQYSNQYLHKQSMNHSDENVRVAYGSYSERVPC